MVFPIISNHQLSGKKCNPKSLDYEDCIKFQRLYNNINDATLQLNSVSDLNTDSNSNKIYDKMYPIMNNNEASVPSEHKDLTKRIGSVNKNLMKDVKNNYHHLNRSNQSIKKIRSANSYFSKMMSDLHDNEKIITNEMRLKERIIEINNEAYREKSNQIIYITGSFIGFSLFLLAIIGYLSGIFRQGTTFMIIVFGLIAFVIMYLFIERVAGSEFKDISQTLQDKIIHAGDKLNRDALEWVDNNCNCPKSNRKEKEAVEKKISRDSFNKMLDYEKNKEGNGLYYD